MSEFIKCFKQYINFKQRATRREFWFFVLFAFIILVIMGVLDYFLATTITYNNHIIGGYLTYFTGLILLLPYSGVLTRRLHDTGKPEIYTILTYIVCIGLGFGLFQVLTAYANTHSVVSLVFMLITVFVIVFYKLWLILTLCTDSQKEENKYGPCPKITHTPEDEEPKAEEQANNQTEETPQTETEQTQEEKSISEKIIEEMNKLEDNIK